MAFSAATGIIFDDLDHGGLGSDSCVQQMLVLALVVEV
jgi:hypothetical protein